ncbi:MAG: HAMP domain-containing protein [Chloroflexales bacterium]|nr:HAMP domain-containing protein [Chloroflexales bacterium]
MLFLIRAKLLGALALDLVLLIVLGYVATQQMAVMNTRASSVAAHTIPSLTSVAALKAGVNEYRINQLEYLLYTSAADKARSLERMGEVEQRMHEDLAAYRPLINAASEDVHYSAVEQTWHALVEANHEQFIPDAAQNTLGSVRPFYSRMNPLYREAETAIADLADESRLQADEDLAVVQRAYDTARSFILFDTLLTLIISTVIGLLLAGDIARRIGRLRSAAGKVATGDLEGPVAVVSRDELGVLAAAFNHMVESLRAQRQALEERNAALQTSLAHQEQLTADLLRRRQAEEEAQRAQAAAEAASQAKSMFLATMSHELRTPLNAILGYAQLMLLTGDTSQLDDPELKPLERIVAAGRHLTALINNVLDFSKIEQGRVELTMAEVAVRALAHEAADVVAPLAQRQGNVLQVFCPSDLGGIVTDAGKVRQILINLLSNAAKFTEGGAITLRAWREALPADDQAGAAVDEAPSWIVFEVRDTGIGIAPEHLGRLFQPFSQVDASVTRRYEGTGLGLALSRQLCLALGGAIGVTSEPGRGTTFTVRLPAVAPEGQPTRAPMMVTVS